jgi:uncharacterized damage-inducible protein DinB
MRELFPVLSRYNTEANRAMFAILADLPAGRLTEDVGSYFKSILAVLNHVYGSDCIWLCRMRRSRPALASLQDPLLESEPVWPTTDLFSDFAALRQAREELDALLETLAGELSEAELASVIDYKNSRGERHRYVFWQALAHMFNHGTHHRGQIAEVLDQFGVANDYSNLYRTLEEAPE